MFGALAFAVTKTSPPLVGTSPLRIRPEGQWRDTESTWQISSASGSYNHRYMGIVIVIVMV
jgi:hypothetical protein